MNNSIYINIAGIEDKASLHLLFKEAFKFPEYYGGNLDALYDMLTTIEVPVHLELCGVNNPEAALRTYIPKLINVISDAAEENPNFTYHTNNSPSAMERKALVVCGSWEDAENLNMFLSHLFIPEITSQYVVCHFSFGMLTEDNAGLSKTKIEFKLAEVLEKLQPAGLIIFSEMLKSPYLTEHLADIGHELGVPVFMLEHSGKNCINFKLDYKDGFRDVVKHIIGHHHVRDVLMMAGFKGNIFSEDRIRVFREVLADNGIPFDHNKVIYGDFWYIPAKQALKEYLESNGNKLPEAIICANDTMAMGCCDYLMSLGYKIPDDCLISGFDGIRDAVYHYPTITTASPDYSEAARIIAKVLSDHTDGNCYETTDYKIPYKLLEKHSCGCNITSLEEMQKITSTLFKDNQDYFMHVHEMGRLTSKAITIGDTSLLAAFLDEHLWLWKDQLFFVGITESKNCVHAVYSSWKDIYEYGNRIYNSDLVLPYLDQIMKVDSGINFLLFSQLRSAEESYGYLCTGAEKISLRLQQRFEEMETYVSSIVHSVLNNNKLMTVNREMKALSELDYMTGLYNRRGFLSRVSRLVKDPRNKGKVFNYITMDLDNLKPINDNYGHQEGDVVIKALAYAIQTRVHKSGISSRFGGDEFAFVIISDSRLEDEADKLRNEIEEAAQYDSGLTGKPYKVLASIGISSCPISDFPQGKIDSFLETLMNNADERMYSDKEVRHVEQHKNQR